MLLLYPMFARRALILVLTAFLAYIARFYARIESMIRDTPAKRAGTADEIADAVIYFLKASNFITGQLLAVDGGLSQR